jgi:putative ABC transport system permease protein
MTIAPVLSPAAWRWAMVQTRRDLRAASMRFLLVAVVLAVAALSAVAFFADRIEGGLNRDAAQLLGADVVVVADQPVPESLRTAAQDLGLRQTRTAVFPSMARAPDELGGRTRLITLKAVEPAYPLRGRLTLATPMTGGGWRDARPAPAGGPGPREVWVERSVLAALDLTVGQGLWLGDALFTVSGVIQSEPDRGAGFLGFSPRVMIRMADLAATQLVQPASRVTWRLLVAGPARKGDALAAAAAQTTPDKPLRPAGGEAKALSQFTVTARQTAETARGVRVDSLDQGRPEMRATLDRAGLFLRLVALLAGLLSAVAVALVSRDFAQRRLDDCALMRVLGVSQRTMAWTYALQFAAVGVLASALGLLAGWLCHLVFVALLADLVGVALPAAGLPPYALGLGVGVLLTLGFGLPPVLQLARVPPLRVLRRDLGGIKMGSALVWLLGGGALLGLLMLVAGDARLGGIALGGFAGAVLVFAAVSLGAVWALRTLAARLGPRLPLAWTLVARQLTAQPLQTVVQVCALGLGLLALMLLVLIRTDLIASWRQATPADAPDRFVINIQPDQMASFQTALRAAGVARFDWYPMARARLVAINGQPVRPESYEDDRAQRLLDREFNLSHAAAAPRHNDVVAGRYTPEEPGAFSVEEGLAQTLGLKLGDRLRFDMAGQMEEGRITSLRKVDWSSMRVNFFVMAPQADKPTWPDTYITSFKAPASGEVDRVLVQRFPNVTVVDVSATLAQLQGVLEQVITAVEFLFLFTLAAGLVVLMTGLLTSRERRARDWAIWRSLGATQAVIGRVQRLELLATGALAGGLAATAALVIGWILASRVFDFVWSAPWWAVLPGAATGALLAWLAGWWSLRGVVHRPVALTLRQAE